MHLSINIIIIVAVVYLAIVVISHFLLYQFIQQKQFLSLTTTEISKGSIVLPIDINLCLRFCVLYGSDFDVYFILLSLISQFMCLDYVSLVAELCPKTVLLLGDVRVCSTFFFFFCRRKKKKPYRLTWITCGTSAEHTMTVISVASFHTSTIISYSLPCCTIKTTTTKKKILNSWSLLWPVA